MGAKVEKSECAAWATLLSAAVGCFAFGVVTDVSEASAGAAKYLQWYRPVGALSGVAGCAVVIWIITWIGLHVRWGGRGVRRSRLVLAVSILLVLASLVMTFPPFYERIAGG